ncbi:CMP-N-acetylneuraminate-beta-galactosamide-alpha-2,3-sialyltransferase 4-like [Piliocolobus tephrosceles]|uniref:CMP-N-acetylneuraminate-beta-galactosamide- alpha-2,3-sialyltransferase 4-like n=1 Tax=Piliocolobus tephrosceles TaxID=591936 RepID=UPI000E6B4E36|nr:CMP-N-acetylneuraminate-beta-galactosamide-alpha-2,3-sialyltransferase 4-like [Piliocolobus tephrosceles]
MLISSWLVLLDSTDGERFHDCRKFQCRALAEMTVGGAGLPLTPFCPIPQKPTTGLLAITLALHLCDLVHIAGFGYPDAYNKKQTIHYYEQITLKSMAGSGHNVSQEALAIKRMLEMGAVKNLTSF